MINFSFQFNDISKFRSALMGLAILGVMVAHSAAWCGNDLKGVGGIFPRLIFTEGFLFLSGLGLYYSYTKNKNIKDFYKRRVSRLWIPYMMMVLPFYIYYYVSGENTFYDFITKLTAVNFFLGGKTHWYISMSLLLYAMLPLFYFFIFGKKTNASVMTAMLVALAVAFSLLLSALCPDYYDKTRIGFDKVPMFIIGVYFGYLSLAKKQIGGGIYYTILVALFLILYIGKRYIELFDPYAEMALRVLCMSIIASLMGLLYNYKPTQLFNSVMGWFGKYSLELYVLHMMFYPLLNALIPNDVISPYAIVGLNLLVSIALCKPVHDGIDRIMRKI